MKKIILIFFLLLIIVLGFLPVKDPDFGWHYRCGNQFLTTGKLCLTNEFSYFLSNYQSYYPGHLYDIILAFVYNHGGLFSVSLFGSIIFCLSALCFFQVSKNKSISTIVFLIVWLFSIPVFNLGLRPQIITYFLFLLLLLILTCKNHKCLFLLPLLFLFWVNLHIGFFVGLFILLFFLVANFNDLNRNILLVVFIFSLLATIVNPFGIKVYTEIYRHLTSPLGLMIAEWVKPNLIESVFISLLSLGTFIVLITNKKKSVFKYLLLAFFTILAFTGQRNLPFFYTICGYIIVSLTGVKIDSSLKNLILPVLISFTIFIILTQVPKTIHSDINWPEYCQKTTVTPYPCKAVDSITSLKGNVFANYEWGGFLIWKRPNFKVFVDGRMPAWKDENGQSPYQVYLDIMQTKPGWNEKLRKYQTDYLLIACRTFLDILLQKKSTEYGWLEKYRDANSVIYQRM